MSNKRNAGEIEKETRDFIMQSRQVQQQWFLDSHKRKKRGKLTTTYFLA